MRTSFLAIIGLMASLSAQNLVYSNGPFQTAATGGGAGGTSPVSVLQAQAPLLHGTYGYGAQQAVPNRLVDQFTVNSVLQIDEIEVFGYATGATAVSCTGVYLSIWDGDPSVGTPNQLIVGGGNAANLMTTAGFTVSNTFTGVYRVLDTALTGTTRNVQSVRVLLQTPVTLTNGTYYLEFSFNGINFVPPLSTRNVNSTGDAKQYTSTLLAYNPILNGTAPGSYVGMPFNFYSAVGSPIEAGSITNLGGGCSTASMTLGGAPTVGGYFRAELSNVNPLAIGVILVGATNPNAPLFVCSCVSHASADFLSVGNVNELQVPVVGSLVGAELFVQGAQLDLVPFGGIVACNFGLQFDLTDGYSFKLNFN